MSMIPEAPLALRVFLVMLIFPSLHRSRIQTIQLRQHLTKGPTDHTNRFPRKLSWVLSHTRSSELSLFDEEKAVLCSTFMYFWEGVIWGQGPGWGKYHYPDYLKPFGQGRAGLRGTCDVESEGRFVRCES